MSPLAGHLYGKMVSVEEYAVTNGQIAFSFAADQLKCAFHAFGLNQRHSLWRFAYSYDTPCFATFGSRCYWIVVRWNNVCVYLSTVENDTVYKYHAVTLAYHANIHYSLIARSHYLCSTWTHGSAKF